MRLLSSMLYGSLLAALLFATEPSRAQLAPSPDAPPPRSTAPAEPESAPQATFRVNANLVSLYFTVKDRHNVLVPTLTKDDCTILEDKVPQTLKSFVAQADQPLTLGILLDTSGSQQNVLPLAEEAGAHFLERVLKQKDEAFLVTFDVDVDLLADYSNDPKQLERAMRKAQINVGGGSGGVPGIGQGPVPQGSNPRGTLLYDAVSVAAGEKLTAESGRKALILITDGQDQGSRKTLKEAIATAQRANAIVYVLLIADRSIYMQQDAYGNSTSSYMGDSAMRKIAEETGGRVINAGNNARKMEAAFQQIEDELRTEYLASYTSSNPALDGGYRKVEVQCKGEGLKPQARKGYYALAPEN